MKKIASHVDFDPAGAASSISGAAKLTHKHIRVAESSGFVRLSALCTLLTGQINVTISFLYITPVEGGGRGVTEV